MVPLIKTAENENGEEQKHLLGFKTVPVFPIHATEGEPLPEVKVPEKKPNLYDVAEALNIKVIYEGMSSATVPVNLMQPYQVRQHTPSSFYHEPAHAVRLKKAGTRKQTMPKK